MKKTLFVLLLALVSISFGFAANVAENQEVPGTAGATVDITASFTLSNADFAGYSIGFSSTEPDLGLATTNAVTANELTDLPLNFAGGTASNTTQDIWYYYKVRTAKTVTITMKAGPMEKEGETSVTLPYTITGSNVAGEALKGDPVNVSNSEVPVLVVTADKIFAQGKGQLTFSVPNLTAANIGTYNAKISFNIVSA